MFAPHRQAAEKHPRQEAASAADDEAEGDVGLRRRSRKMQHLGFVLAADAESAVIIAAERYELSASAWPSLRIGENRAER